MTHDIQPSGSQNLDSFPLPWRTGLDPERIEPCRLEQPDTRRMTPDEREHDAFLLRIAKAF